MSGPERLSAAKAPVKEKNAVLLFNIRDAIAFITRRHRLSDRCIDDAAEAALKVIIQHQNELPGS